MTRLTDIEERAKAATVDMAALEKLLAVIDGGPAYSVERRIKEYARFREDFAPLDLARALIAAEKAHDADTTAAVQIVEVNAEKIAALTVRAEAAEAKLREIHDRATAICNRHHADADEHAARQAYALALHDIAAIATKETKDG